MISLINESIREDDRETKEIFENKLAAYGYVADITEVPFYSFSVDIEKSYFISQEFPKILASDIDNRIITVQYSIDLAKCAAFEIRLPFISKY